MKLLNDLFEVVAMAPEPMGFSATLRLSASHVIYTGHFPGFPVTPAVVQLYIVHELMEQYLGYKLKLKTVNYAKFVKVINPEESPEIEVLTQIEYIGSDVIVHAKAIPFFKCSIMYERQQAEQ